MPIPGENLRIDPDRLWGSIHELAEIGPGRVLTGLKRREEGDLLVFADGKGQEFKVARGDIEEQAASPLSLMPANVAEPVSPEEFQNLLAFLLTQRTGEGR